MILGLDLSTSICGVTVLDEEGKMLLNEAWDFRNKKHFPDVWSKLDKVSINLAILATKYSIKEVWIEQSLQMFASGRSSASVLMLLAGFNMSVSWMCHDRFRITPTHVSAASARKKCGIKVPKGSKPKPIVIDHVVNNEPGFVLEYTLHDNPKPGTDDRADAWVIAQAGYSEWSQKNSTS